MDGWESTNARRTANQTLVLHEHLEGGVGRGGKSFSLESAAVQASVCISGCPEGVDIKMAPSHTPMLFGSSDRTNIFPLSLLYHPHFCSASPAWARVMATENDRRILMLEVGGGHRPCQAYVSKY